MVFFIIYIFYRSEFEVSPYFKQHIKWPARPSAVGGGGPLSLVKQGIKTLGHYPKNDSGPDVQLGTESRTTNTVGGGGRSSLSEGIKTLGPFLLKKLNYT